MEKRFKAPDLKILPRSAPRFIEPMKASLRSDLPRGDDWLFEVKLDGIRAVVVKNGARIQLFSRRPRDLTADYPEIVAALRELPAAKLVADGEIVALDSQGRTSFQLLQNLKRHRGRPTPVLLYLFDLLHLDGRDLAPLPLMKRRAVLEQLISGELGPLRISSTLEAAPAVIWKQVTKLGLEGVIAKRRDSQYEPGRRSNAWLKIKTQNEQEFVIGGYTPPEGARQLFGAVIVGYFEGGKLMFASKVGTGFDTATLRGLHREFQKHRSSACPFINLPTTRDGRRVGGISAAEMRRCAWLQPRLVCQVRFQEWTDAGNLRQPVFLGLRHDKKPEEVVRERPA